MILRIGSKGNEVKILQEYLGLKADGDFGPKTQRQVKAWQKRNQLKADGIVGPKTWDAMGLATTDITELNEDYGDLEINKYSLPKGEFKVGPTNKEYLFIHHTAGWHNPYNVIDQWANDNRGSIGTEFVMGGQSIRGNNSKYDGEIVKAIPQGGYGWHLGDNGSQYMHTHSVGIEVCNFGYIVDGKTYAGSRVVDSQIVKLDKPFRGHSYWHRYSDTQLQNLKDLIIYIGNRDNIDIRQGLISEIRDNGVEGFEFNPKAYYGKIKGLWTHTNLRKDKFDMYPCPRLIDMLLSL